MTITKQDIKIIAGALVAAATAFSGSQAIALNGGQSLSRSDVQSMIQAENPYLKDRQYIQSTLNSNQTQLYQIQRDLARLRVAQARVEVKIDLLLRRGK